MKLKVLRKGAKLYKKNRSFIIILLGLTLFAFPPVFRLYNNFVFALHLRSSQVNNITQGILEPIRVTSNLLSIDDVVGDYPNRILIPSLKIDLEVKPSRVINGLWEIHENTANFGIGSALPESLGNTVIFAHARWNLFAPLRKVRKNDLVSIKTVNDKWFIYIVVEKKEVKADQIEVISQTPDKTLTLYTCSGFADSKRLIVVAKEKI